MFFIGRSLAYCIIQPNVLTHLGIAVDQAFIKLAYFLYQTFVPLSCTPFPEKQGLPTRSAVNECRPRFNLRKSEDPIPRSLYISSISTGSRCLATVPRPVGSFPHGDVVKDAGQPSNVER
ncbi:hypothetical protein Y032_0136g1977 [Ancylostoma ceylanicum]|uniref:Uncharacterized protein n=1 Tax=Ancylostoma ceylanicum TaxID=53326 RepID=A0A016T5H3_9BILA|nr:hypothetical protein Y032_0136g1977 [Ancylostoma ceylanicum]